MKKYGLISLIIMLVLMLAVLPSLQLKAEAAAPSSVTVCGVVVESGQYLAANGTAASSSKPSGGYAYYANGILTLHNYTGSTGNAYGIYCNGDLAIILDSETVNSVATTYSSGNPEAVYVNGDLNIQGAGRLNLTGGKHAVYVKGNLTVASATVYGLNSGLYATGNIYLQSANVIVGQVSALAAGTNAIEAAGSVSVTGYGLTYVQTPDAQNSRISAGIYANGIKITGGTITLETSGYGIESTAGITISGGTLEITAGDHGIYAAGTMTVSGGDITVDAKLNGVYVNTLSFTGGSMIATSNPTYDHTKPLYYAVRVVEDFAVSENLGVVGNTDPNADSLTPVTVSELDSYDYIRIGDFIMLHDVLLPSGYYLESGNSAKTISTTAPSGGKYAYYENNVLTLKSYSYSGTAVGIRTFGDTKIQFTGSNEVNHIISHAGDVTFQGDDTLVVKGNLGVPAVNVPGEVNIQSGRITVESSHVGISCDSFSLSGGFAWITGDYDGISIGSSLTVTGGAMTVKSTGTVNDTSYRAISSSADNPTITITGMNHMAGITAEPDTLSSTEFTQHDLDFVALGEFVMVHGSILYKDHYMVNGESQPYWVIGTHTEYAYLQDVNTLILRNYRFSDSCVGIASNTDLTISLQGKENTLEAKGDNYAIMVAADLTITDVSNYVYNLNVKSTERCAIYVGGDLTVNGGQVNATTSEYYCVYVRGDLTLNGDGLTVNSTSTLNTRPYEALTVQGDMNLNGSTLVVTGSTTLGNAVDVTGNVTVKGGTHSITSAVADGLTVTEGYLSMQGGELTVTAAQNGIRIVTGRLNMQGGFLTATSANTASDSSYSALKLAGTTSDYYNVSGSLAQAAAFGSTSAGMSKLSPASLNGYDYVFLGDYIMIAGKVVRAGQSISSAGSVIQGNGGSGYAYYAGGYSRALTLNGYTCADTGARGIHAFTDLEISVAGNSSISSGGNIAVQVEGDLTLSGSKNLSIASNAAALRVLGDVSFTGPNVTINSTQDTGLSAEGNVSISSGLLQITAGDSGISAKNISLAGGELKVQSAHNGIYLTSGMFRVTGGFATIASTATSLDSNYRALHLAGTSSTYYSVRPDFAQAASLFGTQTNMQPLATANLSSYDYVVIGQFVEVGGVIVRSGYSVNGSGVLTAGNISGSHAYYVVDGSGGRLILDGFTYSGAASGIRAYNSLSLELKYTNILTATGTDNAIFVNGDLTISGSGSLTAATQTGTVHAVEVSNDFTMRNATLRIQSAATGLYAKYGSIIINSGSLDTQGNEYGLYAKKNITVNGGTVTAKCTNTSSADDSLYYAIYAYGSFGFADCVTASASTVSSGSPLVATFQVQNLSTYDYVSLKSDPKFIVQPVDANSILKEGANVSWEVNFTPVKQELYYVRQNSSMIYKVSELDGAANTALIQPISAAYQFFIRSYYNDTEYINSDFFRIIIKAPYTQDSAFIVGGTMTVDTELIAEYGDAWMDAYFNDEITYRWYVDGTAVSGATGQSYSPSASDLGKTVYANVSNGSTSLNTPTQTIAAKKNAVTFFLDDFVVEIQQIADGKYAAAPAVPELEGMVFKGWYTDKDQLFNFSTPITADLDLYAKYEAVVTGVSVTGTVTSYLDAEGTVTMLFYDQGMSEPSYEVIVTGNTANYAIDAVLPGTYTVTVAKDNHVTREYTLTVGETDATLDVEIWLMGDVTGDGLVNFSDYSNVLSQSKNPSAEVLTDYAFQCGDVTDDGMINFSDYSKVLSQAKGNHTLW